MKRLVFVLSVVCIFSCEAKIEEEAPLRWLEDIPFDANVDDPDFVICHGEENIFQYFNLGDNLEIEGDKPKIIRAFDDHFDLGSAPKESGLIRVRFIVNCHGATDRFRMLESDLNYKEKSFDKRTSSQIFEITKSLTGWKQKLREGNAIDYYQYLVFRIEDGRIVKIIP